MRRTLASLLGLCTLVVACVLSDRGGDARADSAPDGSHPDRSSGAARRDSADRSNGAAPGGEAATRVADTPAPLSPTPGPPRPDRARLAEFRGAWVATVDNIDFPSRPGLSARTLAAELDAIVDQARAIGVNALLFQVRAAADAFYASPLEPWSEWLSGAQGRAPDGDFDPLQHIVARCHQHGLQLHAWFNPFRCAHPAGKSPAAAGHVSRRAPQLCVRYGKFGWMDPGHATARKWTLAVIQDVVRRYDIDGVHIDDYFYPYPEGKQPFPDDASYEAYRAGGGRLGRDDWRRDNIDGFVRDMYALVHAEKPWLMVGISPFGIARPGVPPGIQAGLDQFAQIYADVPKWLREGWCDYLSPQLYWPTDLQPQAFDVLLQYWHSINPQGRAIWPGLYTSGIATGKRGKHSYRNDELQVEMLLARQRGGDLPGHVHFSFKALRHEGPRVAGALREAYAGRAEVPRLPWLPQR